MNRLKEIRDRQRAIRARLLEIEQIPEPGQDADEAARSAYVDLGTETDALLGEFDTLEVEAGPLQSRSDALARVRAASNLDANGEGGFHAPQVMHRTSADDAFANLDAVRSGRIDESTLRSRALAGIEKAEARGVSDTARTAALELLDGHESPALYRHALLTGSPAYRSAFQKVLRHPMDFHMFLDAEEADAYRAARSLNDAFYLPVNEFERAALSDTAANGGYAIPFLLDPTVILTNAGAANPFRQFSSIKRGISNAWHGVTSAGVTAEWKSEGAQAADASPTLGQPTVPAYLADAYVFGSYEVFSDTNLASELPGLIADAKNRLEADGFAVGSGSGAPTGVVTATTAVTTSRVSPQTGGTFGTASSLDVYNVEAAVPQRHRANARWVANWATFTKIRQMSPAAAGSAFWSTMGGGMPSQLLGHEVYEATSMSASYTTGSNVLLCGNFDNYIIYDRIGMNIEYIPNVVGTNQRPTAQRGWFATWRTGGAASNPDAFRVLLL